MKTTAVSFLVIAVAFAGCAKKEESKSAAPASATAAADPAKVQITVTEKGFEPDTVTVPAAKPVTLVFTRKTDNTCVKEVILTMGDGTKVEKPLPLDTAVEIAATFPKAGKVGYVCGMDMMKGTIVVQ
jgi:plastocyanin domain-containing protein